jgi:hypothetical protein
MGARRSSGTAVARKKTEFLNIDLDLAGAAELDELAQALSPTLIVVHREPGRVSLELSHQPRDADRAIVELAGVLTQLTPEAQTIWNNCNSREINIGIQAGSEPHEARFTISRESISLVTGLRADVVVTIYANGGRRTG